MMKNLKRVSKDTVWMLAVVIIITIAMIAGLSVVFDFYYDLNDDTVIKDIISGAYIGEPSGYSVQMLYPLSWLLALCYRAIPEVAWYGLFLCLCQFGAMAVIAYRVAEFAKNQIWRVIAIAGTALLYTGFLVRELVIVQYSVTSGICMATAIFLYLTNKNAETIKETLRINACAILLVVVSFMIRTEMCLMLFPFLLLAGLSRWSQERPMWNVQIIKKYFSVLGMALLCMGIALGMDKIAYSQEDWQEYREFFDARTKLYDFYGIPSYEEHQEFYERIGISKESYMLLENYNFALSGEINADSLEQIVEYQEKLAKTENNQLHVTGGILITKNSLKEGIWLYKEHLLQVKDGVWGYLIAVCYMLCVIRGMRSLKNGLPWKIALLLVIRSILWIYLLMVDRMLSRITVPLLLGEVCVLLGMLLHTDLQQHAVNQKDKIQRENKVFGKMQWTGALGLIVLCGVVAGMVNLPKTVEEYRERERINPRWEALLSYAREHRDGFYYVDVYSSTSYQGTPYAEKIFKNVDNSYRNWDLCGGWLAKSPLSKRKDLYNCMYKKACFVSSPDKDVAWIDAFYTKSEDDLILEKIDEIKLDEESIFYVYANGCLTKR